MSTHFQHSHTDEHLDELHQIMASHKVSLFVCFSSTTFFCHVLCQKYFTFSSEAMFYLCPSFDTLCSCVGSRSTCCTPTQRLWWKRCIQQGCIEMRSQMWSLHWQCTHTHTQI